MSRTRLRNSLIITTVGFLLGWIITQPIFSAWRDAIKIAGPPPSATPYAAPGVGYTTYSMIWIDDNNKTRPAVEAMWVIWVPSDYSRVEITNLSPEPFQEQYSRSLKGVPAELLRTQMHGVFGGTLILDRSDIRTLVDHLDGIYLLGQPVDGAGVVNYLTGDPSVTGDEILVRQGAVMQGVLAELAIAGKNLDLPVLLSIPQTTVDRGVLLDLVHHYYPLNMETVQVRAKPLAIGGGQP